MMTQISMTITYSKIMLPRFFTNTCTNYVSILIYFAWVTRLTSFFTSIWIFENILKEFIFFWIRFCLIFFFFSLFDFTILFLNYSTFYFFISLFLCCWSLVILILFRSKLILIIKRWDFILIIFSLSLISWSINWTFWRRNFIVISCVLEPFKQAMFRFIKSK